MYFLSRKGCRCLDEKFSVILQVYKSTDSIKRDLSKRKSAAFVNISLSGMNIYMTSLENSLTRTLQPETKHFSFIKRNFFTITQIAVAVYVYIDFKKGKALKDYFTGTFSAFVK